MTERATEPATRAFRVQPTGGRGSAQSLEIRIGHLMARSIPDSQRESAERLGSKKVGLANRLESLVWPSTTSALLQLRGLSRPRAPMQYFQKPENALKRAHGEFGC